MNTGGNYRSTVPESLTPRMLDIEYREGDVNLLPDLARRPLPVGLLSREAGDRLVCSPPVPGHCRRCLAHRKGCPERPGDVWFATPAERGPVLEAALSARVAVTPGVETRS